MRDQFSRSMITVALAAAAVSAVISVSITRTSGQAARPALVYGKKYSDAINLCERGLNVVESPGVIPSRIGAD
jgi:uncharacterized membrane protein